MPLETAPFINSLDATNPTASDPVSQGDDHIRLIKAALKATFPAVAGEVSASHSELNRAAQASGRFLWGGVTSGVSNTYAASAVPAPGALADGMLVTFIPHAANTGAATLNVSGTGARNLRRRNGGTLSAGDLPANTVVQAVYVAADPAYRLLHI